MYIYEKRHTTDTPRWKKTYHGQMIGLKEMMTAKISSKFSQESPYISNTLSWESPIFQAGFDVNERSPHHSKEWTGKPFKSGDPNIPSLISSMSAICEKGPMNMNKPINMNMNKPINMNMNKPTYTRKGTHEYEQTYICEQTYIYAKRGVCNPKPIPSYREACIYGKRRIYMKRDLRIWKETYVYGKRRMHTKRDVCI